MAATVLWRKTNSSWWCRKCNVTFKITVYTIIRVRGSISDQ